MKEHNLPQEFMEKIQDYRNKKRHEVEAFEQGEYLENLPESLQNSIKLFLEDDSKDPVKAKVQIFLRSSFKLKLQKVATTHNFGELKERPNLTKKYLILRKIKLVLDKLVLIFIIAN